MIAWAASAQPRPCCGERISCPSSRCHSVCRHSDWTAVSPGKRVTEWEEGCQCHTYSLPLTTHSLAGSQLTGSHSHAQRRCSRSGSTVMNSRCDVQMRRADGRWQMQMWSDSQSHMPHSMPAPLPPSSRAVLSHALSHPLFSPTSDDGANTHCQPGEITIHPCPTGILSEPKPESNQAQVQPRPSPTMPKAIPGSSQTPRPENIYKTSR